MSKYHVILFVAAALSFACGNVNQTALNSNAAPNTATVNDNAAANTEMPPTVYNLGSDGFIDSADGTEKAKPDAGKANVQGKVFFNGQPVEGVEVKLCETFSQYAGGCDGENYKTKTDANGEYLLTKVAPKEYEGLLVQVFKSKDYIFATGNYGVGTAKYRLATDKTFFAPATNLFKDDLKIVSPQEEAKVSAQNLELKWNAYPDAAYYKFDLSSDGAEYKSIYSSKKVEGTSFTVEQPLDDGKYSLKIAAYGAGDVKIADSGYYLHFTAQDGKPAAPANK